MKIFLCLTLKLLVLSVFVLHVGCRSHKKAGQMVNNHIENQYYRMEFSEKQILNVRLKHDDSKHSVSNKGLFTVIQASEPKVGVGYCGEYLFDKQFDIFNYNPTHFTGRLRKINPTTLEAEYDHADFTFTAEISLDEQDIVQRVSLISKKKSYYCIVCRSWFSFDKVDYAQIPANVYRNPYIHAKAPVGLDASGYEVTKIPILYQERIVPTPMALIGKDGYYYTLFSDKGFLGEYRRQKSGFGLVDYDGKACPIIAIYPFGSWNRSAEFNNLKPGRKIEGAVRLSISRDWFETYRHILYDEYDMSNKLSGLIDINRASLTKMMLEEIGAGSKANWRYDTYNGMKIGAPVYLPHPHLIKESSPYGIYLATIISGRKDLNEKFIRLTEYHLARLDEKTGKVKSPLYDCGKHEFFQEPGSVIKAYLSVDSASWIRENYRLWQAINDPALKKRLYQGAVKAADFLLSIQRKSGEFPFGVTPEGRPYKREGYLNTFSGLMYAYLISGNRKYYQGAKKGAEWYIRNCIESGKTYSLMGDSDYPRGVHSDATSLYDLALWAQISSDKKMLDIVKTAVREYAPRVFVNPMAANPEDAMTGMVPEHSHSCGSDSIWSGPVMLHYHIKLFSWYYLNFKDSLFYDLMAAGYYGKHKFRFNNIFGYYWRCKDTKNPRAIGNLHHPWWHLPHMLNFLKAHLGSEFTDIDWKFKKNGIEYNLLPVDHDNLQGVEALSVDKIGRISRGIKEDKSSK